MASNRPSRSPSNTGGKIEERSSRTNNKLSVAFLKNAEKKERGRDGLSRRASLVGNFHHLTKEPNGGSAGAPPATPRGAAASVPSTPRQASSNLDPVTPRGGRGRRHSAFGGGEGGGGGGGGGRNPRGAMSPSRSTSRGEKMSQAQKGIKLLSSFASDMANKLASKIRTQAGDDAKSAAHPDLCRNAMWDFTHNPIMIVAVQTCNIVYISLVVWTGVNPEQGTLEREIFHVVSIIGFIVWAFEMSLKMYGRGVWAYFSAFWNVWDFCCTWSVLVDLALVNGVAFAYMRAVRITDVLRHSERFEAAHHMIETIVDALKQLPPVATLVILFILLMALVGRSLLDAGGVLRMRCVWVESGLMVLPESHCGRHGWNNPYTCVEGQECVMFPNAWALEGVLSFDNIGTSILTVCMVILREDFSNVLWATLDSSGQVASVWYFVITVLGSFFLMNYPTAIITHAYAKASTKIQESLLLIDPLQKEQGHGNGHDDAHGDHADRVDESHRHGLDDRGAPEDLEAAKAARNHNGAVSASFDSRSPGPGKDKGKTKTLRHYARLQSVTEFEEALVASIFKRLPERVSGVLSRAVLRCRRMVLYPYIEYDGQGSNPRPQDLESRTPYMEYALGVCILAHTALLAQFHAGLSKDGERYLIELDSVFCYIFAASEAVKVTAWGGFARYLAPSHKNRFELGLTFATTIIAVSGYNEWVQLSQFRALKVFYMVLSLKQFSRLKKILRVAVGRPGTMGASLSVIICTIGLFALVGRQIFHGMKWANVRGVPHHYFDNFIESLVTVTEVITKERVQIILQEGNEQVGAMTMVFVIVATVMIDLLVLRIVTAVILHNYHSSDSERIRFQLQFERLAILKGWSEEDREKEWSEGSTEHRELIVEGNEETVLVPNAAGLFVALSAAELAPPPTRLELALERLLKWVHSAENTATEMMGVHSAGGMLRFRHINLLSDSIRRETHGGDIGEEFKGRVAFEIQGEDDDESPEEEGNVEVVSKKYGVWGRSGVHWDEVKELLPVLPARHEESVVIRILADNGTLLGSCRCDVLDLTINPMCEVSLKFVEAEKTLSEEEVEQVQKDRAMSWWDGGKGETLHEKRARGGAGDTLGVVNIRVEFEGGGKRAAARRHLRNIFSSKRFDHFVLVLIFLCIFITAADHGTFQDIIPDDQLQSAQFATDIFFVIFFFIEFCLKIFAFGAVSWKRAYFRSGWNVLDFVMLMLMFVGILPLQNQYVKEEISSGYSFRAVRIIRPVMSLSRFSGLKTAVLSINQSFDTILAVMALQLLLILSWAIGCIWHFSGEFGHCSTNISLRDKSMCGGFSMTDAERVPHAPQILVPTTWVIPSYNFDTLQNGLMAMYRVINRNGWGFLVVSCTWAAPEGSLPKDKEMQKSLPILAFQIIAEMMLSQAFVAILINSIDVTRRRSFMTRPQKLWQATLRTVKQQGDQFTWVTQPCGIKRLQAVVQSRAFELTTTLVVTCNVVLFGIDHRGIPEGLSNQLERVNYAFIAFYCFEQTLKIAAFSHAYFFPYRQLKHGQGKTRGISVVNFVDFIISAASLADAVGQQGVGINVLRTFRVIRLVNILPSIRALLKTAKNSILTIVGCFFFLVIFIFAFSVVGVPTVGGVKRGYFITRHSNFDTTINSVITLFQMVAGEDWMAIMQEASVRPPYCTLDNPMTPEIDDGDCGNLYSPFYFVTFMTLCYYFFLPLFVASFISTFFETIGQQTSLEPADANTFEEVWEAFDPLHTGKLSWWKLRVLVDHLVEADCGLAFDASRRSERFSKLERIVESLEKLNGTSDDRSCICFKNVLLSLVILSEYEGFLSTEGGISTQDVIVQWARSRNAVAIRDFLLGERARLKAAGGEAVAGKLHVWVLKAQNLRSTATFGDTGFGLVEEKDGRFCTVTVGEGAAAVQHKTRVVVGKDSQWESHMVFDMVAAPTRKGGDVPISFEVFGDPVGNTSGAGVGLEGRIEDSVATLCGERVKTYRIPDKAGEGGGWLYVRCIFREDQPRELMNEAIRAIALKNIVEEAAGPTPLEPGELGAHRAKLKLLSARCGLEVDKVAEVLGHGIPETPERESSLGRPAVSEDRYTLDAGLKTARDYMGSFNAGGFDYLTGTPSSRVSDMLNATPILGKMANVGKSWGDGILPSRGGGLSAFLRVGSAGNEGSGVPNEPGHGVDGIVGKEGEGGRDGADVCGNDAQGQEDGERIEGQGEGEGEGGLISKLPPTPQMGEPAITLNFPANSLTNGRKAALGKDESLDTAASGSTVASMIKSRLSNPFGAKRWFSRTPSEGSSMPSTAGGGTTAGTGADAGSVVDMAPSVAPTATSTTSGAEGSLLESETSVLSPKSGRRRGRLLERGPCSPEAELKEESLEDVGDA